MGVFLLILQILPALVSSVKSVVDIIDQQGAGPEKKKLVMDAVESCIDTCQQSDPQFAAVDRGKLMAVASTVIDNTVAIKNASMVA